MKNTNFDIKQNWDSLAFYLFNLSFLMKVLNLFNKILFFV